MSYSVIHRLNRLSGNRPSVEILIQTLSDHPNPSYDVLLLTTFYIICIISHCNSYCASQLFYKLFFISLRTYCDTLLVALINQHFYCACLDIVILYMNDIYCGTGYTECLIAVIYFPIFWFELIYMPVCFHNPHTKKVLTACAQAFHCFCLWRYSFFSFSALLSYFFLINDSFAYCKRQAVRPHPGNSFPFCLKILLVVFPKNGMAPNTQYVCSNIAHCCSIHVYGPR